ncbi:agamous-like MADS-box protein AGL90 [Solanum stenotomum]|uniref:agamous-like MADS-box protein AGL90 n=1 Tax=Solanum stenotomum TaxID=172797 RepID=UPI0020D16FEA|nr:agamous-like MADS-box protein AGL90 [Solanum stenotomum]
MVRKKVKLSFMENSTERRVSYRKRQKGFLTKTRELNTLCDVELATLVNSPYHNEPEVFPNHEAVTGMFTKFIDLPEKKESKNMKTHEKIIEKRIEKIEKELEKVRKENKKMEYTNQMYGLLNGELMPNSRDPDDLNDLCYVINKNLKLINDRIKAKTHEEGSTSNAPQPIVGPMNSGGTSFDMSWVPLLAPVDAPCSGRDTPVLSEIPLLVSSTIPSGTNFEMPRAPLNLVPDVTLPLTAPLMVPSNAPAQIPQFISPLRTPPQMVPLVDLSQVPSLLSSQRYPEMAYPILPTTMAYPMPSPMITPPMSNLVFPPTVPQIDTLMNIPSMSASAPMDNNVDGSLGIPQSPSFSDLLSLNDDEIMTLLDDTSFDINVQDPNHHHNNI